MCSARIKLRASHPDRRATDDLAARRRAPSKLDDVGFDCVFELFFCQLARCAGRCRRIAGTLPMQGQRIPKIRLRGVRRCAA